MAVNSKVPRKVPDTSEKIDVWETAIRKRDIEACRALVAQGADVNEKRGTARPLHWAIAHQTTEIAAFLLSAGANPHLWDARRQTMLFRAAARSSGAICELLINHGADPNARDIDKSTPLHEAANGACTEVIKVLLAAGADVNAKNLERETPLHKVLQPHGRSEKLGDSRAVAFSLLVCGGGDLLATNKSHQTVLQKAVSIGRADLIRPLLEQNPDLLESNRRELLHTASAGKDTEFVDYLLKAGCSLDVLTPDRSSTALHNAAQNGAIEMCRHLVGLGLSPSFLPDNPPDKYRTPMQWAVMHGRDEIVSYFMDECGEEVAQRTLDGCSLLQLVGKHVKVRAILQSAKTTLAVTEAISSMADPKDEMAKAPVRRPKMEPL